MRSRRWLLPALSGVAIVILLLAFGIGWLTKDRVAYTGTPTPPAFADITPIELRPGQEACETEVAFERDTRKAVVLSAKFPGEGPPLRLTARGGGWSASGRIEGGYMGAGPLAADLPAPPRSLLATVCVENTGRRAVALQGTTEGRIQARPITSVDGEEIPAKMTLLLTEGAPRSLADRPGEILDRIAAFKPPFVGKASLILLLLLVLVGVPGAVVYAIWRGIAADGDDSAAGDTPEAPRELERTAP